ncbi:NAD(P)-binding domain-containing protein [Tardiphaga sp. 768_D3_N2_1]|uniref:NAD(P)-binding domain-containing protein n=1 Tax=Tardiphaga sp. 768_D3_N2_1 TaxID=3240783 RepID=UPI003F8B286C
MANAKTVAIIGAGPVGLAAASHILERGMTPIVLEAGPEVGHAVRQWGHVQLFSPWEYNVDPAARRLLEPTGWNSPEPEDYPTGSQLVEQYLVPLASRTKLQQHILTSSRVTDISRQGLDKLKSNGRASAPFEVRYETSSGTTQVTRADAVIDVSGTWTTPNPAGANGLYALGEKDVADRVAYAMPDVLGADRAKYAGRAVAVLGAGHSAIGTLTSLAHLKREAPETTVIWLLRGEDPARAFGGGANDKLAARGELGSAFASLVAAGLIQVEPGFRTTRLSLENERLHITSGSACCSRHVIVDELIVATGFRPNFDFVRELRIRLDSTVECPVALAPLIDPNEHSCGTVRPHGARELAQDEPGFYFAGMKSYGRAPTFLMLTGYEQVRSIAADIAGDREAAERVELVLPETGVCSRTSVEATNCCGGPEPAPNNSCCAPAQRAETSVCA